jgi:UDP-N-acetyl-D-glucosamine/UDP-N-acetyl-D-galactosamine dehydrogenase
MKKNKIKLAIIGLGYVGLPLAIEFAKNRTVIGFDTKKKRIEELKQGIDKNLEISRKELKNSKKLIFTSNTEDLKLINCFIVSVPTPIDEFKKPDLTALFNASKIVGKILKKNNLVIYESTVYPGCTEEYCIPILEKFSGLKFNKDFFCGYSPERINPGDKEHRISNIKKITSGSTTEVSDLVDQLYNEIITAGTHMVSSIKVAEAAKVIENTQRDLNIAFINELSMIFNRMNIDTEEVLNAAATKWNFLYFKPGLVGGHCIGVDPYYLTYKAESIGYHPKIILSGREINDKMGIYVATELVKAMKKKSIKIAKSKILVMGLTFKENCADIRNSGVTNVILELKKHDCNLDLYDPWADQDEIIKLYKISPILELHKNTYDAIILAVAHNRFRNLGIKFINSLKKKNSILYDLKHLFKKEEADLRL